MVEDSVEGKIWYVRSPDGKVYGPTDKATLAQWSEEGRIEPAGFVSRDRRSWIPAQLMPELEMKWVVEAEPGKFYGPFNRKFVVRLSASGGVPQGASIYRRHDLPADRDPDPVIVEKIVEKEVRVEVPVEKIVEKIVVKEVPVEVEKIVERIIEVEPPARKAIEERESGAATAAMPPPVPLNGVFKNVSMENLAALEQAARRELAAAKSGRFGGVAGLFSRRRP